MNVTSISLAYLFLGIGLISLSFFIYFKILTSNSSKKSEKIVGDMKDSKSWLNRNNKMAYVSLFWSIVSLCLFIYLKFFTMPTIISLLYVIGYIFLIVISVAVAGIKKQEKDA
ncbi:hypothetical protein ACQX0N_07370 [Clostridium tepidum]|jgi:hypothetical protein|uniref:DUF3784 domain-containing protein n=1 Tax=Clostridium tepidum TaxID=1962263 RepID=A0A1S9I218_9CLOT|nr:hypothetical protein [Clostridium tepidum]MCR1933263.1 hypothetical protein [Clostridium tepidum]MDU6877425.1 hypothetical protein [Clostridium botulinum]OOO64285.1 hypothetical protein BS638_11230 [Clostridium tepidum]